MHSELHSIGLHPWGIVALVCAIAVAIAIGLRVVTEWGELSLGKRASSLFELAATILIGFALFAEGRQHSSALETLTQRVQQAEATLANVQDGLRRQMADANTEIAQLHATIASLERASVDGAANISIVSQTISRLQAIVAEAIQGGETVSPAGSVGNGLAATEPLTIGAASRILLSQRQYGITDPSDPMCREHRMTTVDLSRQERYCVDVGHSWMGHLGNGSTIAVLPATTLDGQQENALLYALDGSTQRYLGTALFAPHPGLAVDVQRGFLVVAYRERAKDGDIHVFRNAYDPAKKRLHSID